ncbi:MAG: class I SAM-dependent methyltransferase [Treponema sp.]|nr:class I SAM-dependent methyltransferase [Treponema sp.]
MIVKHTIDDFNNLWQLSEAGKSANSKVFWADIADNWISEFVSEEKGKPWVHHRVCATSNYLKQNDLINSKCSVVDIGCGPGLFVIEFAKTAKYAMGIDYSNRFIQYGRDVAKIQGIHNVEFCEYDFENIDIDSMGLTGAFDLAFSCISGAICSLESINKLMKMSHSWCYCSNFVSVNDSLIKAICYDIFGEHYKSHHNGTGFYSLFNILWLMGYRPETNYFVESHTEVIVPTWEKAQEFANRCHHKTPEETEKIFNWLNSHREIERKVEYAYGGILWDIRIKDGR